MSGIFSKVAFWLRSKNRHGIHSPFIYEFLDRGLYAAPLKKVPAQDRLLKATLMHFKPKKIGVSKTLPAYSPLLKILPNNSVSKNPPFDLFIYGQPSESIVGFLSTPGNRHNDSMIYIGNLRASARGYALWEEISRHDSVRVVLETYQAGLLFFRREQAREYFRIRT